jgi:hypothetical protein
MFENLLNELLAQKPTFFAIGQEVFAPPTQT